VVPKSNWTRGHDEHFSTLSPSGFAGQHFSLSALMCAR
jgi:hypothetical protein